MLPDELVETQEMEKKDASMLSGNLFSHLKKPN